MKLAHALTIVSVSVLSAVSFGANVRETLQSRYDEISKLSMKKDKDALEKTIRRNSTSSFQFIDIMKNSLDLEATIRQNTEQLASVYRFNRDENRIIGIRQVGDELVCTVKTTYDAYLSKNHNSRVKGVSISEDTWTKTIVGWKIKKSILKKSPSAKTASMPHIEDRSFPGFSG